MQKKKRGPTPTGSVIRRGNNKYQAQIMINGQRYTETFRDEASAHDFLADIAVGDRRPDLMDEIVAMRRFTLGEVIDRRIAEIDMTAKSAYQARSALRQVVVKAPDLCKLRMRDILVIDIEKLMKARLEVGGVGQDHQRPAFPDLHLLRLGGKERGQGVAQCGAEGGPPARSRGG